MTAIDDATDVVSVERMLRELGLPAELAEVGNDDFDQEEVDRLTDHIRAAVDRIGGYLGGSLLDRECTIVRPAPEPDQTLNVNLPDWQQWTGFEYHADDDDGIYGTAVEGTLAPGDDGYPPTFAAGITQEGDCGRPRFLTIHPNGLDEGKTRQWPAMADNSVLKLTASVGWGTIPEALKQAVVIVTRSFYDGHEQLPPRLRDAALALCQPWQSWFANQTIN